MIGAAGRFHVVEHSNDYTAWVAIAFKYLDFRSSRQKSATVLLNSWTREFDVLFVPLGVGDVDETNNVCGHASPGSLSCWGSVPMEEHVQKVPAASVTTVC